MITLSINAKCSDCCSITAHEDGSEIASLQDYPPRNIGIGGGDCIRVEIDVQTGQIVGWNELSKQQVLNALGIEDDE